MDVAGRQIQRLTARQRHPVQQQRQHDARIPWVRPGQLPNGRQLPRETDGGPALAQENCVLGERDHPFDQPRDFAGVAAASITQQPVHNVVKRLGSGESTFERIQSTRLWIVGGGIQSAQLAHDPTDLAHFAESTERLERLTQRVDELWLVERVAVVAA